MNYKFYARKFALGALDFLKLVLMPLALIFILQLTGLMSSVSYLSNWALLQTGLKDSDTAAVMEAPDDFDFAFTIKNLEGNKIDFNTFKGKVVFLNLWATWCGPCRAEMAGIEKLYKNVNHDNIAFVMLSIDKDADHGKIIKYIRSKEFTFPIYQPSGFLPNQLRVPSIPTTFIISKEGKIIKKEVGSMRYDKPKFQKFLEDLSRP
ncbi:MAG: TlpA family protein disulfide reductase [Cyclobacteriaceae bacterium]|nr:TlpA family protein disulfide reductase [Cyclobacteriaceae bacterium]